MPEYLSNSSICAASRATPLFEMAMLGNKRSNNVRNSFVSGRIFDPTAANYDSLRIIWPISVRAPPDLSPAGISSENEAALGGALAVAVESEALSRAASSDQKSGITTTDR